MQRTAPHLHRDQEGYSPQWRALELELAGVSAVAATILPGCALRDPAELASSRARVLLRTCLVLSPFKVKRYFGMPAPRALTSADRNRVFATLQALCSTEGLVIMRTRALIVLAADSGLRVSELCNLDANQLLAIVPRAADLEPARLKLASSFYLRPSQAKGGDNGAGTVELTPRARGAVLAYLRAAIGAGWIPRSLAGPLFVGHRGARGAAGHGRLSVRSAQHSWYELQARARLSSRYGFHCLRHDAASRWRAAGADLFTLMRQMRWKDTESAQLYMHHLDAARAAPKIAARLERTDKGATAEVISIAELRRRRGEAPGR